MPCWSVQRIESSTKTWQYAFWIETNQSQEGSRTFDPGGGGAGSEAWNRVDTIAPVKKFGRVGLCTNFISNKHGGGEEGELAELAFPWCTRVCVGSALFPLLQV